MSSRPTAWTHGSISASRPLCTVPDRPGASGRRNIRIDAYDPIVEHEGPWPVFLPGYDRATLRMIFELIAEAIEDDERPEEPAAVSDPQWFADLGELFGLLATVMN